MEYTLQQVEAAFAKAPPAIQQTLESEETGVQFAEIAGAFELSEEQFAEFVDETGLLLLGLTPFAEYEKNLATRLKIDGEHARALVERTGADILTPFRTTLGIGAVAPVKSAPAATHPNLPAGSRPSYMVPEGNEALERLEDTREKNIRANMHEEKLGGMVASGAASSTISTPGTPPQKGDPYREPID
jgi:hypothetical protein